MSGDKFDEVLGSLTGLMSNQSEVIQKMSEALTEVRAELSEKEFKNKELAQRLSEERVRVRDYVSKIGELEAGLVEARKPKQRRRARNQNATQPVVSSATSAVLPVEQKSDDSMVDKGFEDAIGDK